MAMEAGAPRGAAATTSGGGGGAPEAGAELGSSGAPVTWGRVWRAGQEAAAHALLLCFTALLALKLDGLFRGSCPSAEPLSEIFVTCSFITTKLSGHDEPFIDLKLVFLPLLALEIITLVDNFRMCGALMPGHGETMTDEAIWERLPHFWVAISMVFLLAATSLMLLKLCGSSLGGLLMKIAKRSKLIYAMQIILERALISAGHAQFVE
uniref:Uncharacterized protein n=1 Tax=Oryza rufipogon TaxID=4529 RepID=A0A0E0QRB0_ORYRU